MKKFLRVGALCLALAMALKVSVFAANKNLFNSRATISVDGFTFDIWSILYVRSNNKYSASGNIQKMNSIRFSANILGASSSVVSETSGELVSGAMMGNSANEFLAFSISPSVYTSDWVYASGADHHPQWRYDRPVASVARLWRRCQNSRRNR